MSITNDQLLEGDEDFFGLLALPSGSLGVSLGVDRATVVIQDDDGKVLSWTRTICIELLLSLIIIPTIVYNSKHLPDTVKPD